MKSDQLGSEVNMKNVVSDRNPSDSLTRRQLLKLTGGGAVLSGLSMWPGIIQAAGQANSSGQAIQLLPDRSLS